MRNQIRTLNLVFSFVFFTLGLNAFTSPAQQHIYQDITDGKIEAAIRATTYLPEYLKSQQEFRQMNMEFDVLATRSTYSIDEAIPQLSRLSQLLYVFEKEMNEVSFYKMNDVQKKALIERLSSIKSEFYLRISALR